MRRTTLSRARYVAALRRLRQQIADGSTLLYYDDDTPGDKHLHCEWGLCSEKKAQWPDPPDHQWPDQFVRFGRVAPLPLARRCWCPFDHRLGTTATAPMGCFYHCRIFQPRPKKGEPVPSRAEALLLFDKALALAETTP